MQWVPNSLRIESATRCADAEDHLEFRCIWTDLRVENTSTIFTSKATEGQLLHIPMSHGEGNYQADEETISRLENNGQVIFRYSDTSGGK
ncbi:MAG: hypothetical protein Ct9H300mP19_09460 [Dehalococcoidia bacterium]|nr:MAG: hypothetical protein Ct9H300mP19_09460 [Dehalococcoidia bacterium]